MKRVIFFIEKGYFFIIIFVILFIFFQNSFVLGDSQTNLTVTNTPPILQENIPDQSWPKGFNNTNAFDLDDYFIDPNGDTINYNYSSVEDINVFIDSVTNIVSFYNEIDFMGIRYITFYAQDNQGNSSSNPIKLSVGVDNSSPNWSSPAKSKGDIYQNDFINFTTSWVDDVQLLSYVFSINQGATGWINYSSINFSGTSNLSIFEVQISASQGKLVEWMFYAWDTSGNINSTANQSFIVEEAIGESAPPPDEEVPPTGGASSIREAIESLDLTPTRKLKDFKLNVFDFKLSLKQGTSKTVVLKISNIGTEDLSLSLEDTGLLNFVLFSEKDFELLPGNSKEVTIDFRVPRSAFPGQYYGFIKVNGIDVNKTIPVVLDVQQIELDYDVILNISEEYKTVLPGEDVLGNFYIYNIKDLFQTNVTLYYAIKDYNGTIYNFNEEKINFSTSFLTNRSLQVPQETSKGKYIFYVRVSDDKNIAIDSDFFFVGERFSFSAFFKSKLLFLLIIFLSLFLAIFMVKYQKDRRKQRILHLYMMLTKLKNLIKQSKTKQAMDLFLKIRSQYKEPLSQEVLQDKEKLKKEMLKLYEVINPEALKKLQEQEKQNKENTKEDSPEKKQNIQDKENSFKSKKAQISNFKPIEKTTEIQKNPEIQKSKIPVIKKQIISNIQPQKILKKTPSNIENNRNPVKKVIIKKIVKKPAQKHIKENIENQQKIKKQEVNNEKK